jgi:hypothetical protein
LNDTIGNINIGKLNVVSNVWLHVFINSTSAVAGDPSKINYSFVNLHNKLQVAFGVGGDLYRGAFWYVGGSYRIKISPNTGTVSVAKNLIVNGIIVDCLNILCPFWICGKVSANAATYTQHRRSYGYACTRVGVGFYTDTCVSVQ